MAVLNHPLERPHEKARQKQRASLHPASVLLAGAVLVAVTSLLRVVQTSDAATSSFAIQAKEQEKLELQAVVHDLEAQVGELQSLDRIEAAARERGLVPPVRRVTAEVNVPWTGADESQLPTRFALGDGEAEVKEQDSSWWRDLLDLLPF